MKKIKDKCVEKEIWSDDLTPDKAVDILGKVWESLEFESETPKGRKRRTPQLCWTTFVNIERKKRKLN